MCGVFGEIVCWQKKKKKSSAGSQGFLYWKACREEHWDAGDAVHPRLARGPECRVTRYENDFSGVFGEGKGKSLVRCYGTFSSRRDGAKTLSCIETYFSSVPGYKTPLLIPRCSSQGHFLFPRLYFFLPFLFQSF